MSKFVRATIFALLSSLGLTVIADKIGFNPINNMTTAAADERSGGNYEGMKR